MSDFDRPEATIETPAKRRSTASRFADLGDRLARTFGGYDHPNGDSASGDAHGVAEDPAGVQAEDPTGVNGEDPTGGAGELQAGSAPEDQITDRVWNPIAGAADDPANGRAEAPIAETAEDPVVAQTPALWEAIEHRFPTARRGYDRGAVDRRISELEREIDELRARASNAVAAEIERIGEQTAAILSTAHEQAQETTRRGQEEADRCIANAASNAVAITQGASRQLRQLDSETDAVWRERAKLIEDVRNVATALLALAGEAAERFPAEPERSEPPVPVPAPAPAPDAIEEPPEL
jgi:hypothetical protein